METTDTPEELKEKYSMGSITYDQYVSLSLRSAGIPQHIETKAAGEGDNKLAGKDPWTREERLAFMNVVIPEEKDEGAATTKPPKKKPKTNND